MKPQSPTCSLGFYWSAVMSLLLLLMTSSTPSLGDEFNCTLSQLSSDARTAITRIDCVNSSFARIPGSWPVDLDELNVSHSVVELGVLGPVNYTQLGTLHLEAVGLRGIEDFAFRALSKLKTLNLRSLFVSGLSNNRLTGLTQSTFSGLTSLETLILQDNRLYELTTGTFSGSLLPSLLVLHLNRCRIYRIESQGIAQLARLQKLFLAENFLEEFPSLDGVGLGELQLVNASSNRISALDDGSLRIPASVVELDLSYNKIATVRLNVTNTSALAVSALANLHMRYNVITEFKAEGLELWRSLDTLDLAFNSLRAMNASSVPWDSAALRKVLVHDNPWDCTDCTNSWLVERRRFIVWDDRSAIQCSAPPKYAGTSVYDSPVQYCAFSSPPGAPSYSPRTPGVVAGLVILVAVVTAAVVAFVVVVRRRQARRLRELQAQRAVKGGVSYRQMKDLAPFSIGDDD